MSYSSFVKFNRLQDGTGALLDATTLALDATTPLPVDIRPVADPVLTKVLVEALFFPNVSVTTPKLHEQARRAVVARLDAIRTSVRFKPVIVKTLARGIAVIPNVHQNFGDLLQVNEDATEAVILANCCLLDAAILDDDGLSAGIKLGFTFGRVCDALTP